MATTATIGFGPPSSHMSRKDIIALFLVFLMVFSMIAYAAVLI